MNPDSKEPTRGAEILRSSGYRPKANLNERGSNRLANIAFGALLSTLVVAPMAYVAGYRIGSTPSISELSSNEVRISAACALDPSILGRRIVRFKFDQQDYQPVRGGVVLVFERNDGTISYRHLSPDLSELTPTSNFLEGNTLRNADGIRISLFHEQRFIDNDNSQEKDTFEPKSEILEQLGTIELPADFC